jgi:Mn2+/Fe2+ NRAMP family transporter
MRKIIQVLVLIPLAIMLVALSVANRGMVAVTVDPFNPGNPALTASAPLYAVILLALMLGAVIGSALTWLKQGRHRARARSEASRADLVAKEAASLKAEREALLKEANTAQALLPVSGR